MEEQTFGAIKPELVGKIRTVNDIARFIRRREESNEKIVEYPSYSLLLGSGASFTSGIETGGKLVKQWRHEIMEELRSKEGDKTELTEEMLKDEIKVKNYLSSKQGFWYDSQREYSSLFERKFDLPSQRRKFIEQLVEGKVPSIGYRYLINLVSYKYFNNIFTTNFDDLLNEAFYQFSDIRPQVCAHDSSISSLSVLSQRPKIIKLHGDYLYDDIKNTVRETESLESNTRDKFIEFSKDYGLIVVGYSGGDRTVMDVLNYLVHQSDYLKNGVYWCLRENDQVSHELRKFLWKDKVYCVEIEGFDEFFAELNSELSLGLENSSDSLKNYGSKNSYIELFLKQEEKFKHNKIISSDIETLKRNTQEQDISELITKLRLNDDDRSISSYEFKELLEIQHMIKNKRYEDAMSKISMHDLKLKGNEHIANFKDSLIRFKITALDKMGRKEECYALIDNLIQTDVNNLEYVFLKASYIKEPLKVYVFFKSKIDDFKYSYQFMNEIVRSYILCLGEGNSFNKEEYESNIRLLENSLRVSKCYSNKAYYLMSKLYMEKLKKGSTDKEEKNKIMDCFKELVETVKAANPLSKSYITCCILYLKCCLKYADIEKYIKEIIEQYYPISSIEGKKMILNEISGFYLSDEVLSSSTAKDDKFKFLVDSFFNEESYVFSSLYMISKWEYSLKEQKGGSYLRGVIKGYLDNSDCYLSIGGFSSIVAQHTDSEYIEMIYQYAFDGGVNADKIKENDLEKINKNYIFRKEGAASKRFKSSIDTIYRFIDDEDADLVNYSYDLLLSQQYLRLIDEYERFKTATLSEKHKRLLFVNYLAACKLSGDSAKLDESHDEINRIISVEQDSDIVICLRSILGGTASNQAYSAMIKKINNNFYNYYSYIWWPAIDGSLKEKLKREYNIN